jgi:hypothetical protein
MSVETQRAADDRRRRIEHLRAGVGMDDAAALKSIGIEADSCSFARNLS